MSELLGRGQPGRANHALMWSFYLSQGDPELQNDILSVHFDRNPDQLQIASGIMDDPSKFEQLSSHVTRHTVESHNHSNRDAYGNPLSKKEMAESAEQEMSDLKVGIARLATEGTEVGELSFVDIGAGILASDAFFYGRGRVRTRPSDSPYGVFHPRVSQFVHYGVIYPEQDKTKIESVATDGATEILTRVSAVLDGEERVELYGDRKDIWLASTLRQIFDRQSNWFPQFSAQLEPYLARSRIFKSVVDSALELSQG